MKEQEVAGELTEQDIDGLDGAEDGRGRGRRSGAKPWDPAKIRITTQSFTLREVVDQINDHDIDLSPDFQREYVWKTRQKTRLIESVLLGIPLPAFYFNQTKTGTYQVVDGVQRLSTIQLFMGNGHRLSEADLEYLSDLNGMTYEELDNAAVRRFRSTQIVVHVIEPQTPDEVKYDIFSRVNTLGSPLSAQEIRHAMSETRSRKFVARLAESDAFDEATKWKYWRRDGEGELVRDSGRMANRELALRFCAFRTCSIEDYRQFSSLDGFLMDFTKRIDGTSDSSRISEKALRTLEADFILAMNAASIILGPAAFRRWPSGAERRGPINRAVFEAQANALADHPLSKMEPHKEALLQTLRSAFLDPTYLRAVTVGTGDPNQVSYRLTRTRELLNEALK